MKGVLISDVPAMLKGQDGTVYLKGARFWGMSMAYVTDPCPFRRRNSSAYYEPNSMATMMFLTNLEIPVVTTALVAITDDLQGFNSTGWVVASYLLGYVGLFT